MNTVESGEAVFQPRARLLKLIGAELISDDVVALTELVKNAHDADASTVAIAFRNVTEAGGEIVVLDDGEGMDRDTLLNRWMEPASTAKAHADGHFTKSGRRMLGEKGVGRFAADKLARRLELISRKAGEDREVRAFFDWDEFDTDSRMLSEIECRWEVGPRSGDIDHGTLLRLTDLRAAWNERMFRRVSTRLSRLHCPFACANDFRIRIDCDEFPQYSGELRSDFLKQGPYQLEAEFDGQQSVNVNVNGSRSVRHLWNGNGDLSCGPVRVRLFAFDLESDAIARIGPPADVRAWLREWSGVSIYRDGFRVWPYGEPHDDWLRLDQRRVNNPVVRLSNNQLLGFVEIAGDRNPDLKDQTNREGLINNRALQDLRRLLYFLLQILEAERQSVRHPKLSFKANGNVLKPADEILRQIAVGVPRQFRAQLKHAADAMAEEAAKSDKYYRRLIEGYSGLAALGQAADTLSALTEPLSAKIVRQYDEIEKAVRRSGRARDIEKLEQLRVLLMSLFDRLAMMTPLQQVRHRRGRLIDLAAELEVFRSMVSPLLEVHGIRMDLQFPRSAVLRVQMHPESLHRVLYLLTINSLDWLHDRKKPEISVELRSQNGDCQIVFSDNGPGIDPHIAVKVFEPLFSTKEDGLGMGLTIARDIVSRHQGSIDALTNRRGRGATIRILLPRKRSRASASK